ncbi:hypothetical protein SCACP_10450 [Sporomusa carbonis]|uniref:DUF4372 domain-containing protein n=1 Tax=Sporomusa carbonis TaxID=3076075 RepID=UPI003A64D137
MDKDITKTTLFKAFEAFPYEKFKQICLDAGCDRYVKKSKTLKLLYLMVIAQFLGEESLHSIANLVTGDKRIHEVLHLTSISASTLSRRLRSINFGKPLFPWSKFRSGNVQKTETPVL